MPIELLFLFAGAVVLSAFGFVCVATLWLRKVRETLSVALKAAAEQQIRSNQRVGETIAQLQKQQDTYTHQLHVLAEAGLRLQQEMSNVNNRLDNVQNDASRSPPTVH